MGKTKWKSPVKFADDPARDQTIIKKCDICGDEYHPRKNSYQLISRYCSQECSRKGVRERLY